MNKVKDIFVTASIYVTEDDNAIEESLSMIDEHLSKNYAHHEILLIGDIKSKKFDSSIDKAMKSIDYVRFIRVFGEKSIDELQAIGFENAIGDVVVSGSFSDLVGGRFIVDLVQKCIDGNDIVFNSPKSRFESFWHKCFCNIYRDVIGPMLGAYNRIPHMFDGLCCVSRRAINSAIKMPKFTKFPFLRLVNSVDNIGYDDVLDVGLNKRSFRADVEKAIDLIAYNTVWPTRIICVTSLAISIFAFVVSLFTSAINSLVSFFAIDLFAILFLMNESFNKLIFADNGHEQYSIEFEKHSSVMLNTHELNIRSDSVSDTINNVQTGRDR